tara:strand:- start:29 stop:160 length:132 start_codon:yes stop_codon:yes gene_type:complete
MQVVVLAVVGVVTLRVQAVLVEEEMVRCITQLVRIFLVVRLEQ